MQKIQVSNLSLGSQAYQELKRIILEGRVPPGAKLNEGEFARALGISRTPIREAINRLEKEGLVEIFPQRGAFVVQFTEKDVYELFLIRENLEGLAARLAAGKITPASLSKLESCLEGFKEPFREKDVQRYSRASGNPQVHEMQPGLPHQPRQIQIDEIDIFNIRPAQLRVNIVFIAPGPVIHDTPALP